MKKLDLTRTQKRSESMGRGAKNNKFYLSTIKDEIDLRIIPPLDNVGDVFWLESPIWWISQKPYISPEMFEGRTPVIDEEIERIKEEYAGNKKMLASIDKLLNSKNCQKRYEELVVACIFEFTRDKSGEIVDIWIGDLTREEAYEVRKTLKKSPKRTMASILREDFKITITDKDNVGKYEPIDFDKLAECISEGRLQIVSMGQRAVKSIVGTLSKKALLKEAGNADLGGLDQYVGFNTTIYKSGKDRDTVYTAEHDLFPMEMPDWMFEDKNKPDLVASVKQFLKSDEYLIAVIRHYLLGEDMPEDEETDSDTDTDADRRSKRRTPKREDTSTRRRGRDEDEDEDEEDDYTKNRKTKRKTASEDEEEDAPENRKTKRKTEVEDEDDYTENRKTKRNTEPEEDDNAPEDKEDLPEETVSKRKRLSDNISNSNAKGTTPKADADAPKEGSGKPKRRGSFAEDVDELNGL